jgi:pyrroloquinoline quinone biosynthesis protein E
MQEPCRSCERRREDFGGCRCQAFLLTGDSCATDPVCSLSPEHHRVEEAIAAQAGKSSAPVLERDLPWTYRENPRR